MKDLMKNYSDMGIFYVTMDEEFIKSVINRICENMNFYFNAMGNKHYEKYILLENLYDIRSFLFAAKLSKEFWCISIKCKMSDKQSFFENLEPELSRTQDLWGMPYADISEYRDWLHCDDKMYNPVIECLKMFDFL